MENSGLSIPQAPPASAIGNVAGKIRMNARGPASRARRTTQSLTLASRAPKIFCAVVRESVATSPVATITRTHARAARALGKRLRAQLLTLQLKVLNRRSVHGVVREDTGQFAKKQGAPS